MHTTEQQIVELSPNEAFLSDIKLRFTRNGATDLAVGISTKDWHLSFSLAPEKLLLAARTLCEPETPLKHSARLQRVLDEIAIERTRQITLLERGEIQFNCADSQVPLPLRFSALTEEQLEATREIQNFCAAVQPIDRDTARRKLRTELIQLAAVATAIVESLQP